MGFFSGLAAEKYDRQYTDKKLLSRMMIYFKTQSRYLVALLILILIRALIDAYSPVIVARGLDQVTSQTLTTRFILTLTGVILALGVLSWLANLLARRSSARAISDLTRQLSTDAFEASIRQDLAFHDSFSSGKIVSRITSDTREFGQLITLTIDVIGQLISSVILAVILFQTEWRLALAVMALIPILFLLVMRYRFVARKITREGMRAMANVNSTIKETVSGIAIAKNFRQEEAIYQEFAEANETS
jgi:ATP-binding cassette subfamily B protein